MKFFKLVLDFYHKIIYFFKKITVTPPNIQCIEDVRYNFIYYQVIKARKTRTVFSHKSALTPNIWTKEEWNEEAFLETFDFFRRVIEKLGFKYTTEKVENPTRFGSTDPIPPPPFPPPPPPDWWAQVHHLKTS